MTIQAMVRDYYGRELQSSADLKTDACCTLEATPPFLRAVLADIHPEVAAKYYGCGLVAPLALGGARILDLGCGAGRDVYALSRLVGEQGFVTGVDFTPEQLATARAHQAWHADRYGYRRSNVDFIEGDIEDLGAIGLADASFDVIVSNCVINLCADKEAVFRAARRRVLLLRRLRRSPPQPRPDERSHRVRGMSWRRALLERFPRHRESGGLRRPAPRQRPPAWR